MLVILDISFNMTHLTVPYAHGGGEGCTQHFGWEA
jgi:hypothetical protein